MTAKPLRQRILTTRSMVGQDDGWSKWVHPNMEGPNYHTLLCCDCHLVHRFRFKVVTSPDGTDHQVVYKVKRMDGYTFTLRQKDPRIARERDKKGNLHQCIVLTDSRANNRSIDLKKVTKKGSR